VAQGRALAGVGVNLNCAGRRSQLQGRRSRRSLYPRLSPRHLRRSQHRGGRRGPLLPRLG
jgi:hypothetical protein